MTAVSTVGERGGECFLTAPFNHCLKNGFYEAENCKKSPSGQNVNKKFTFPEGNSLKFYFCFAVKLGGYFFIFKYKYICSFAVSGDIDGL